MGMVPSNDGFGSQTFDQSPTDTATANVPIVSEMDLFFPQVACIFTAT